MEIINKGLHAFRGFSDDPILSQQELEFSGEDNSTLTFFFFLSSSFTETPQQNSQQQNEHEKPAFSPSEDIVIDFGLDGGSPVVSHREPHADEQQENNIQQEECLFYPSTFIYRI